MKGDRKGPVDADPSAAPVSIVAPRSEARAGSTSVGDVGVAAVVHEVRNVLTTVRGWVQLARGGDPSLVERAWPVIEDGIDRARHLLDGVTSLDARAAVEDRTFALDAVAARVADLLEASLAAQGVSVRRELTPTAAYGDPDRVAQIALNLGLNAMQAIASEGGDGVVTVRVEGDGETARLTVEDDGPGMDEGTRARIFDAFFSTKSSSTATRGGARGLGLAVSRAFAEAMGGRIEVRTAVGAGCAITLSLRGANGLGGGDAAPAERRLRAGMRVLVLDDEPSIRELLEVALSLRGAQVIATGDLAVARRAVLRDEVDAALVDETLGETSSGSRFLGELAMVAPRVGRVLMTGAPEPAGLSLLGSSLLVRKPFLLDDVVRALAEVDAG